MASKKSNGKVSPAPEVETELEESIDPPQPLTVSRSASDGNLTEGGSAAPEEKKMEDDWNEEETSFTSESRVSSAKKFGIDEMDLIEEEDEEEEEESEEEKGREEEETENEEKEDDEKTKEHPRSLNPALSQKELHDLNNDMISKSTEKPTPPKLFPPNRVSPLPLTNQQPAIVEAARTTPDGVSATDNYKDESLPFSTRVEAWSKGEKTEQSIQTDIDVDKEIKSDSTAVVASFLTPYKESSQHEAYIPMQLAKQYIEKIVKDMETMRSNHYKVVEQIEEQYRLIEMDSQKQFNDYVLKLRDEYRSKVTTFKHVIEVQQKDFQRKQEFYEKAIKSLREKNRSLLLDKRNQLQRMKETHQNYEEEKTTIVSDLTGMCDKQYREVMALRKHIEEIEGSKKLLTKIQGEKAAVYDMLSEKIELIGIQENQIKEMDVEIEEKARAIGKLESQVKALERQVAVTTGTSITASVPPAPVPVLVVEQVEETAAKEQSADPDSAKTQGEKSALYDLLSEKITIIDEKDKVIDETNEAVQMKSKVIEKLQSQVRALERQVSSSMSNRSVVNDIATPATEPVVHSGVGSDPSNAIGEKAALYELLNEKIQLLDERDKQIEESNNLIAEKKKTIDKLTRQVKMLEQMTGTSAVIEDPTTDDKIKELHEEISRKTEEVAVLEEKVMLLNSEVTSEKEKVIELEGRIQYLELETNSLTTGDIPASNNNTVSTDEPSITLSQEDAVLLKATPESEETSIRIAELSKRLEDSNARRVEIEATHEEETSSLKKQIRKLDKKMINLTTANEELIEQKRTAEGALRVTRDTTGAEIKMKDERIDDLKKELEAMKESSLGGLPVDAKEEVLAAREKLEASEEVKERLNGEMLELKKSNGEFMELIGNMEIKINALQVKEVEREGLIEVERKYKDLKIKFKKLEAMYEKQQQEQEEMRQGHKKEQVTAEVTSGKEVVSPDVKKLEQKVNELEVKLKENETKHRGEIAEAKKEAKGDAKALSKLEKANEVLQSKVDTLNAAAKVDAEKVRDLDQKLKDAVAKANDKNTKKLEKNISDLQKKLESEEQRMVKLKEDIDKEKAEIRQLTSQIEGLHKEKKSDQDEIEKLKLLATEGEENAKKVKELTAANKTIAQENKIFAENFHSERILRKKYYNMVEDMKGKIRVYCRARPLSRSELDRGNHNIISSPDEYTLVLQTGRGTKEFQYDAVFTAEHTQNNVFEDTNRLIQSAVDGYNVCIFAYGQTGSGKTFTMIGDKEQKFPGIAPRSFEAIYSLIEENITKYSFKTTIYMLELYRDNLIDLFAREGSTTKLDIKKDKKGMVMVQGAIVHEANSSEELMELFEKGSSSRHVASTKMNAESSRSHLILSVIIESTNLTSGAVLKGKLSLVDLAGSERASKTEASAEQLKEAQSINKSLSALGDVISALSSEQSFVPYRNNKLTMLMQDSLGGNAKTLMFVNISPADYNMEETLTSLTYAARVKLITNDASKNSESKEIAKLKAIITKLKSGDHVTTDEEILSDVND